MVSTLSIRCVFLVCYFLFYVVVVVVADVIYLDMDFCTISHQENDIQTYTLTHRDVCMYVYSIDHKIKVKHMLKLREKLQHSQPEGEHKQQEQEQK